jgi:carboxylesterase type B
MKPAPPVNNDTLQTGEYGPACPQTVPLSLLGGQLPPGLPPGIDLGLLTSGANQTGEDCLFLDVYVPGKAWSSDVKLPIINWIYGGAYLLGSKEGQYDGTPIIKASGGNVIYIAANYRVCVLCLHNDILSNNH